MGLRRLTLVALALSLAGCDELAEPDDCAERCASRADDGVLLLSDRGSSRVLRFDAATGAALSSPLGPRDAYARPSSARPHDDGTIYVADFADSSIDRYDAESGVFLSRFYRDTYWLEEPVELHFVGDQLLVLGNDSRNIIALQEQDGAGTLVDEQAPPALQDPHDFLPLSTGEVVIAGSGGHGGVGHLLRWDLERGEAALWFGTDAELGAATGLALGPDGLLYVADEARDQLVRFELETGAHRGALVADDPRVRAPIDLAFGRSGALYVLCDVGVVVIPSVEDDAPLSITQLVSAREYGLTRPRSLNVSG
ncbi:MAG: PQQ-binding-like beta-propeller repeat protein [Myxococcales bacterium]|nr:PQQ-binding-like beta-propeller repeat protein [Myxococcales bacterium]